MNTQCPACKNKIKFLQRFKVSNFLSLITPPFKCPHCSSNIVTDKKSQSKMLIGNGIFIVILLIDRYLEGSWSDILFLAFMLPALYFQLSGFSSFKYNLVKDN
ncbi:hypothetical protein RGQ13_19835 [Thalassotalea psychrophila]|uniref:CXXC-20-CXXC protein n=1 Tax=Thalassotalea psychrophila TaxID=3065647 RepID=A0ABY9TU24_9GAMM|nr:hypothetical protein RGQ13_19835 [Colwelliaceae bacterium SQ149]